MCTCIKTDIFIVYMHITLYTLLEKYINTLPHNSEVKEEIKTENT